MKAIWSHIAKMLGTVLLGIGVFSCNDYLDEIPDNRVELDNLDKASQLLTNGYSIASPAFTDWMTTDFQFTFNTSILPIHQELYEWEEVTSGGPSAQDSPDFFWFETYNAIAHANEVLAVLAELPLATEEDQLHRDAIEAEAKLIRAYGHFMLVNIFAEHYDAQTASSDLGVPYIDEPETEFLVSYKRSTVQSVYNQIEDDLEDALELVNDNFYLNSGKYHFNRNAALAFASRFYLYKSDYTRSVSFANQLLDTNPEAFVRDMTSDEFLQAKSSITGYPQLYSSPDLPANLLLMRKISLVQRPDFAFAIPNSYYSSLFQGTNPFPGTTDERENPAFVKGTDLQGDQGLFPVRYQSLFQRSSLNSNVGTPYHIGIMMRGEEVLLNRIECNIFLRNIDVALADLNVLFARRYSGADNQATMQSLRLARGYADQPSVSDLEVLFYAYLDERHKEFLSQGLWFFDLKRFGIPMTHTLSDGSEIRLEYEDPRWVLQLPTSAIQVGGLEPNPR
jgi:hypothetical protein